MTPFQESKLKKIVDQLILDNASINLVEYIGATNRIFSISMKQKLTFWTKWVRRLVESGQLRPFEYGGYEIYEVVRN